MAMQLEANVNILWQNLIALNASLIQENEERRGELLQTKKLLDKETENSKVLQKKNEKQKQELSKKNQKIARLSSKMVALRKIILHDSEDDCVDNGPTAVPVIVKVESNAGRVTQNDDKTVILDVCTVCGKKFAHEDSLKRHMVFHLPPKIPCAMCPLNFPRQDYLRKHIQKVHKIGTVSKIDL